MTLTPEQLANRRQQLEVAIAEKGLDVEDFELQALAENGWHTAQRLRLASKEELEACVCKGTAAALKAAFGSGRSAHEAPPGRPFKRVKLPSKCSDLAHMSKAEAFLPSSLRSDSKVAFYAGRPRGVPLNIAPPALLCAPEFGIVHDAAHFGPSYSMAVGASEMDIARELCNKMSKCYPSEDKRQEEFVDWFNRHFQDCGRMVVPEKMSASKEGGTGANDGQVVVRVNSTDYLQTVLEVKNESGHSGDPLFQGCRYYQRFYMDGQRWSTEDLLRAIGAPAFTFDLQGCDLVIGAVYTVEGNVVAREPLTDKMALLDLGLRMRVYEERLARVLAAFRAAARLLTWRIKKLAGCEGLETLEEITDRALAALPQPAHQDVVVAMRAALLSAPRMAQRPQPAGDPDIEQSSLPWARLPYPLAPPSAYPQVESLPGMASRAVFKCSGGDQAGCTCVLVKFEQRPYPVEVHKRLQSLNLVPSFISTQRLPGGWWAVEQEFLDAPWRSYDSFLNQMPSPSRESRAAAASAVAAVVAKMHGVGIVHGDLRPLNVLLRETVPNAFEVKLVDLEWAGVLDDVPVYPLNMAARSPRLPWHGTAGPGKVLKKEHDEHLLQQLFY